MREIDEYTWGLNLKEALMVCIHPDRQKRDFVVYRHPSDTNNPIHINTNFEYTEGLAEIRIRFGQHGTRDTGEEWYFGYDRSLCKTEDEFRNMTIRDVEHEANNAWLDGAK